MENRVKVRACFTGCNIKSGKTVMQFELDPEHKGALPQLAMMTGTFVTLEVLDGQEEAFSDEFGADDEPSAFELPPADYEYEGVEDEAA